MTRLLSILILTCSLSVTYSQISIQGRILDQETKSPLSGASIQAVGTEQGTISNDKGFFSLLTFTDSLLISYVGYEPVFLDQLIDEGNYEILLVKNSALSQVEVSAQAPQVSLRTLEAVTLLGTKDIVRMQELSPLGALNQIPGVYMQSGALNTNRITIRGIGNRSPFSTAKIRAYLDEIPLTDGAGETTIEDIDLSFIEQVKVWKGPTASNYGAALGGMIHLQTSDAFANKNELRTNFEWGEFGLNRQTIQSSYAEQGLELHLNYNRTHSDGYRDNNEYDRTGFALLGKINKDRHLSTLLLNYADVKAFIPSSLNETDFLNEPSKAAFTWAQVMGFEDYNRLLAGFSHSYDWWRGSEGKRLSSTLSLFGTLRDNYESRPFNILREQSWSGGYRFTMDYQKGAKRNTPNAQIGIEWFRENYQWTTNATDLGILGDLLSDNLELRSYYNIFGQWELPLPGAWFGKIGANLNITNYELTDYFLSDGEDISGDYGFEPIFSPRLSLGYQIMPQITVFGTVSHGFSAPSLEETLNPDGSRNPDIQPERGWNFELGSRGAYLGSRLNYDVAFYRMQIQDLLVARRTALDQFIGINAGETIHQGFEASINYIWLEGPTILKTQLSYNFADYRFEEFIDGDNDFSGNELTGAPPHQLSAWLDLQTSFGFYSNLTFEYVDAFPMRDDNSIYSESYQFINAKIGWQSKQNKPLQVDIYLGMNNVFDERYASMILINAGSFGGRAPRYFYPGLPRNIFGGIKLAYQWSNQK